MERTLEVLHRLKRGENLLRPYFSEDLVFIDPDRRDAECRVADLSQKRHILKAPLPHGALDGIPRSSLRLEMEVALMILPINDVPKVEPPYMPLILPTRECGAKDVSLACIIAAPESVETVAKPHPEMSIVLSVLDSGLDARKYVIPGLGDFGDRLYCTHA